MPFLHFFAACARHAALLVALSVVAAQCCSDGCACAGRRPGRCRAAEWDAALGPGEGSAADGGSASSRSTEVYVHARIAGTHCCKANVAACWSKLSKVGRARAPYA